MMKGASISRESDARNTNEPITITASQAHAGTARSRSLTEMYLGCTLRELPRLIRSRSDADSGSSLR